MSETSPNIYEALDREFYAQDEAEAWAIHEIAEENYPRVPGGLAYTAAADDYNRKKSETNEQGEILDYDLVKNSKRWLERRTLYLLGQAKLAEKFSDEQLQSLIDGEFDEFEEETTSSEPYESDLSMVGRAIERHGHITQQITKKNISYIETLSGLEIVQRVRGMKYVGNILEFEKDHSLGALRSVIDKLLEKTPDAGSNGEAYTQYAIGQEDDTPAVFRVIQRVSEDEEGHKANISYLIDEFNSPDDYSEKLLESKPARTIIMVYQSANEAAGNIRAEEYEHLYDREVETEIPLHVDVVRALELAIDLAGKK